MKKEWLIPAWKGKNVYRETFAMVEEKDGCQAAFSRIPEQIIRAESYDGTMVYEEGKDFWVKDGKFVKIPGGKIPSTDWSTFYYDSEERAVANNPNEIGFGPVATTDGRYLNLHAINHPEFVTKYQVAVTYTTREENAEDLVTSGIEELPDFYQKAKAGKELSIVLYGDSICCGYDCSGFYGQEPNQSLWFDILMESLQEYYHCTIHFQNSSVAGMGTEWALEHVTERVTNYHPDLVILGFGMNDRCSGEEYQNNTEKLWNAIRKENPETEAVLIATSLPNELAKTPPIYFSAHQGEYAEALKKLCKKGVVLADVQNVQRFLQRRKRYIDITGNWLNHPNDYLARIYAQVLNIILKPTGAFACGDEENNN